MKNSTRILACILVLLLSVGMLAACGGGGSAPAAQSSGAAAQDGGAGAANDKPYAGTKISFIGFGAIWSNVINDSLGEFKEKTGIDVDFQQLANDQISNKVTVSMAAGGKDLDVYSFRPLQETLLFTNNGWLEPLDEYIARTPDFDYGDFTESSKDICERDGTVYGIPLMTEREILFYNKELLEKAGVQPPKTMDELMEAAKKLNDPANGISGIAIRGKGSDAVTQFSGFLRAFGGEFHVDGKATINTPEAIAAFKYYGDLLREYGPPGVANMGWTETQSLFAQGKAAMRIDCDSQFGFAIDPESSLIADKVGYATLPAGPNGAAPFNIVAWCLGISPGSPNKDASWEFISWALGKEMDVRTQNAGNPSTRDSTWAAPGANESFPAELVEVINETIPVGRGTDRPYMISVGEARTAIGTVIVAAIEGKDVEAAANAANAEYQALLDKENS